VADGGDLTTWNNSGGVNTSDHNSDKEEIHDEEKAEVKKNTGSVFVMSPEKNTKVAKWLKSLPCQMAKILELIG
jgi:hypothetical protein